MRKNVVDYSIKLKLFSISWRYFQGCNPLEKQMETNINKWNLYKIMNFLHFSKNDEHNRKVPQRLGEYTYSLLIW